MNDTICLMLTPLVLRLARRAGVAPKPYLIALATSSNIGSVMTPMGNPQNMIIAIHSGIPFLEFALRLAPIALIGLWLNHLLILRLYPPDFAPDRRFAEPLHAQALPRSRLLYVCLGTTVLLLGLFAADASPPLAALGAACLLILAGATRPRNAFRHIDWELLLMFAGLFVVMGGLRVSGALSGIFDLVARSSGQGLGLRLAAVAGSSALASNVVSNVPCVVFFTQILPGLDAGHAAWLVLAMASTLAGNLTLIGSVANLIVLESSKGEVRVGFWEYCRVGTPLAAFLIAAGTIFLYYSR
jgi:Na+/H+ antiporter NhaD/arsenite permease-like protein